MESRFRAQFINSLSGFKSANLIGTADRDGLLNLAIFSSVVHLGANPPLVGFVMRPDTVSRHTFENLEQTGCYTINHVNEDIWQHAHQTSARYDKLQSEFEQTNLTPEFIDGVDAPFVKESLVKYSVNLKEIVPIALNQTTFIIGEINDVICLDEVIARDGYIDVEATKTVALSGLDSYHQTKRLSRLTYAKPHTWPTTLNLSPKEHEG
jgi:flavin reductase (DIM6/NTAB) family NADH-FMN oxidoreductase RutF